MIEFGLGSIDIGHVGVPVDHAGDAIATTAKLSNAPDGASSTSLHINNNIYDGTIYDKNLWTSPPDPNDHDKVCGWVHDMAAAEPQSVCEQWSADDWNSWVDHYEDQDCGVPKCGESYPAQLLPYDKSAPADVQVNAAQLNPSPQAQLVLPVLAETDVKMQKDQAEKLGHFSPTLCEANADTAGNSSQQQSDLGEDCPSQAMNERSWSTFLQVSRATPGHFVLSFHALFLAAMQNLVKGGDSTSFKQDALNNAASVTPVGQALMTSYLFQKE